MKMSNILFCGGLTLVVAAMAMFWSSETGEVSLDIADKSLLAVDEPGIVQRIPVSIFNSTSTRVRLVGTNAC